MELAEGHLEARQRSIALWLFAICVLIYGMVLIGGLTRLTYSGLSMVEWKPLTGWLPPLTPEAWEEAFAKYRQFPEYRELNAGMSLTEFKEIFWLEYVHRVWGRMIGVAFLVPFLIFLVRGWIDGPLLARLLFLFVLGGLQGLLGWYMVQSGLVDIPDVSAYRLVAHLGFAVLIYAYTFWAALGLRHRPNGSVPAGLRRLSAGLAGLVFVTILSGGFMAGINAGFAYNTFPKMDGQWIPDGLFAFDPWYVNFFEDVTTVQFTHRLLATTVFVLVVTLWLAARRTALQRRARRAVNTVLVAVLVQVALGVSTLLMVVPVPLAVLHQTGGVFLFTASLWAAYELNPRH